MSALRDASTVLDHVMQCMRIGVADVEFRASELIEMIAKIAQSGIPESVINAGNALANYVESNGSYDKVRASVWFRST